MKLAFFLAIFALTLHPSAFADDKPEFAADVAARQDNRLKLAEKEAFKKTVAMSVSNQYALGVLARFGMDVSEMLEVGVEVQGSLYGAFGGGLYVKAPIDKKNGLYAIGAINETRWFNGDSNNRVIDGVSVGVGKEFQSGAFIEARSGLIKRHFKDTCVHNDYGTCVGGGSETEALFTVTVGTAF